MVMLKMLKLFRKSTSKVRISNVFHIALPASNENEIEDFITLRKANANVCSTRIVQ